MIDRSDTISSYSDLMDRLDVGDKTYSSGHEIRLETRLIDVTDIPSMGVDELQTCRKELVSILEDNPTPTVVRVLSLVTSELALRYYEESR